MNKFNPHDPTPEEIERHYNSALESVKLLNNGKPPFMSNSEWADCVVRNKEHLKIMLAKPWWTNEDLSPLQAAAQ